MGYIAIIFVCAVAGFALGVFQSFIIGMYIGTWDGGTGLLFGGIVATISLVAAVFVGWWALAVAVFLPVILGVLSFMSIHRE